MREIRSPLDGIPSPFAAVYRGVVPRPLDPFPWVMWIGAGDGGAAQTNDFAPLSDFLLMGA